MHWKQFYCKNGLERIEKGFIIGILLKYFYNKNALERVLQSECNEKNLIRALKKGFTIKMHRKEFNWRNAWGSILLQAHIAKDLYYRNALKRVLPKEYVRNIFPIKMH